MTTLVHLVRHAQSAPSKEIAEAEWPLSTLGVQQASQLVDELGRLNITRLVSSPYRRAFATLEPFAQLMASTIEVEADLRERKLTDQAPADWQQLLQRAWREPDHAEPNAESNNHCQQRVRRCLTLIAERLDGETAAAASHGNAIALMLNSIDSTFGYEGWRAMKNPDRFLLRYDQGQWDWLRD